MEGGDEETNVCICTELCIEGSINPDCPVCNAKEADLATCLGKPEGATTVESWRFVENTDGLVVTEESGSYYVQPSPGETGIPLEELTALLPQAVEVQMDGAAVTVAITGWSARITFPPLRMKQKLPSGPPWANTSSLPLWRKATPLTPRRKSPCG